jgi:hypothetical protein
MNKKTALLLASLLFLTTSVYSSPVDAVRGGSYNGRLVWKKKPEWVDATSTYWKLLQDPLTAGERMINWIQPGENFRLLDIGETKIREWQFQRATAEFEVTNRSLLKEIWESDRISFLMYTAHPSLFEHIEYDLIPDFSELERVQKNPKYMMKEESLRIQEFPAKLLEWDNGNRKSSTAHFCRVVLDLPRHIRISADQSNCSSSAIVKNFAEKLRVERFLEQLGISTEEKAKLIKPLVVEPEEIPIPLEQRIR